MKASRQEYIDKYAEYAMEQMRRYGIPASITLAQGIIESADGKSTLAQTANNHFGVKGEHNGNYVLANDDKPNEKFKKYENAGQSYEDHSKVLMASRYRQHTSGLAADDYRGWAEGIKKGGYATASNYASTIVGVIESCNLQKYDQMVMAEGSRAYSMPVSRSEFMLVTSPYGKRVDPMDKDKTEIHHGIDIKTKGEAVLATENNGKVVGVDKRTATEGGKTVTVEYEREDGTKTRVQYMHLSHIDVLKGDTVNAGQKLGVSGDTGTRCKGEHLHFGVINVAADGAMQWVNPAAYLAEISEKGSLAIEAQHNGKDLLADYRKADAKEETQPEKREETAPESWMNLLLGSDDSAIDFGGEEQGLLGSLMQMFMALMMLAMRNESESKEAKIQAVTDAAVNRRIDLTAFAPNLQSAALTIGDGGKAMLTTSDGKHEYSHELTNAEKANISRILASDSDDAAKQQKIGGIIYSIAFSQQAAQAYEQIESQQQAQQQTMQRK